MVKKKKGVKFTEIPFPVNSKKRKQFENDKRMMLQNKQLPTNILLNFNNLISDLKQYMIYTQSCQKHFIKAP